MVPEVRGKLSSSLSTLLEFSRCLPFVFQHGMHVSCSVQ